jgi:tRNA (cmo5U34)-methyltransferase
MKFHFDTIKDFDKHISQSIPNYLAIHEIILGMSEYFIEENTNVFDLGCSKGTLLKKLMKKSEKENINYFGLDVSKNLLPKNEGNITFLNKDLTTNNFDMNNSSLIFSIFTLQFLPKKERLRLLKKIYNGLNKGGALVVTEKVYSRESLTQDLYTSLYYEFKSKSFSYEEIMAKEKDLRPIMKLLTKEENVKLFEEAGFKIHDTFFQYYNFVGWICIK